MPVADLGTRVTQVALPGQTGSLDDTYGHGTFVAGIVAGKSSDGTRFGIAPGASIYALNVNRDGAVYSSDIIAGLTWVAAKARSKNIRVVNLSLAETTPSSYKTSALDQAVEAIWKLGVVVVVSAGNGGPNSMYYAPANDPFVITVGASDPNDTVATADDTLATFSSTGTTPDGFVKPELVAPGRHIVSAEPAGTTLDLMAPDANHVAPGYLMMNGSSFSAPQVAGAAALLLQAHPDWTADEVKGALLGTARALDGSTAGALDIKAALALTQRPQKANGGVQYSIGPVKQNANDFAQLNTAAANDAVAYQRAAAKLEGMKRYEQAAQAWSQAGDRWSRLKRLVNAAAAYDRSSADYATIRQVGPRGAGVGVRRSGTSAECVDRLVGALVRVRRVRVGPGRSRRQRRRRLGAGRGQLGDLFRRSARERRGRDEVGELRLVVRGRPANAGEAHRERGRRPGEVRCGVRGLGRLDGVGRVGRNGRAGRRRSAGRAAVDGDGRWTATAAWTATAGWTASAGWTVSAGWTTSAGWTAAAGWTATDQFTGPQPADDSSAGWG